MDAFEEWIASHDLNSEEVAPSADPDLDGLCNLSEFLHPAGNPRSPAQLGSFLVQAEGTAFAEVQLR